MNALFKSYCNPVIVIFNSFIKSVPIFISSIWSVHTYLIVFCHTLIGNPRWKWKFDCTIQRRKQAPCDFAVIHKSCVMGVREMLQSCRNSWWKWKVFKSNHIFQMLVTTLWFFNNGDDVRWRHTHIMITNCIVCKAFVLYNTLPCLANKQVATKPQSY